MKTQTTSLTVIQFVYDNGKSEILVLSPQQIAGLKRSKKRKTIITKTTLAVIELSLKILNQPL